MKSTVIDQKIYVANSLVNSWNLLTINIYFEINIDDIIEMASI